MKRLATGVLALTLALSPLAAISKVECPELDAQQAGILNATWKAGEEKMGTGWGSKLSAVALQESELGHKRHGNGSYGTFQMTPATATEQAGRKVSKQELLGYSMPHAIEYLTFWREKGYSDLKVFASFNGGYKRPPKAYRYARSVQRHVVTLNQCFVYRNGVVHERHQPS